MTTIYLNIVTFGIGILTAVMFFHSCGKTSQSDVITKTDTLNVVSFLPSTTDTLRLKYAIIKRERETIFIHDTVTNTDTLFKGLPSFSLISDNFVTTKKDTITSRYNYPENKFVFDAKYSPDTVTTVTNTITILPSKFSFGVQTGIGYLQSFRTGQNAVGWYVGFGIGYKL